MIIVLLILSWLIVYIGYIKNTKYIGKRKNANFNLIEKNILETKMLCINNPLYNENTGETMKLNDYKNINYYSSNNSDESNESYEHDNNYDFYNSDDSTESGDTYDLDYSDDSYSSSESDFDEVEYSDETNSSEYSICYEVEEEISSDEYVSENSDSSEYSICYEEVDGSEGSTNEINIRVIRNETERNKK